MATTIPRILAIALLLLPTPSDAQRLRVPAQWEPQERVLLSWFGQGRRDSVSSDIVKALLPHVNVTMNVASEFTRTNARAFLAANQIDSNRVDFVIDPNVDYFVRDYSMFVADEQNKLRVVDFVYTAYGRYAPSANPIMGEGEKRFGQWESRLAAQLGLPLIASELALEAGGIDTDGNGTFLMIRQMALQRNPHKSLAQIEDELKRTLGARTIIWLEHGLIEDRLFPQSGPFYRNYYGGGANMHVDELARFVNDSTVILPYIPFAERNRSPVDSINYPMLEANARILEGARTAAGKRITVVRIPMPEVEQLKFTLTVDSLNLRDYGRHGFARGDTIFRVPAASYVNYFVSNGVVLIPKYWKPGMPESQRAKDEVVREAFAQFFPGRSVISVFALGINRGGGGIHCATRDIPAYSR